MAVSAMEAELQKIAAAVGHYSSWSYFQSIDTPENHAFVQSFRHRYGADCVVSDPVEAAYTQVYLWKQAVETAQSIETDRVRMAAYGLTFKAPSGWVSIEPNQHISKLNRIGQLKPNGKFEILVSSDRPIKPLPWLGVEEANGNSAIAIEMLAEVSQSIQYSCQLEQKSRELEATLLQLQQEVAERQRSEAANRALISAIPDLLIRLRGDGTYLDFVSGGTVKLFDPVNFRIGSTVSDSFPSEMAQRRMHYIKQALQTGTLQVYEQRLIVNGVPQDEEVRIAVLNDDEVLLMVRDITERKRTENALQQSEATNRALIAAIPDLLLRVNSQGTYLEIVGCDRLTIQNESLFLIGSHVYDSLPYELAELRMHYIQQALETGEMQLYEHSQG